MLDLNDSTDMAKVLEDLMKPGPMGMCLALLYNLRFGTKLL